MIKLDDFQSMGLSITWRLIDIGFRGSSIFYDELLSSDIINYAISQIDDANPEIVELACEHTQNIEGIDKYIKKLAANENVDYDIEFRKWRVIYVYKQLPKFDADTIEGLTELGDIWARLEYPADSPHVFQGRGNNIRPEQYYTIENYHYLLNKHIEWLNKEKEVLSVK